MEAKSETHPFRRSVVQGLSLVEDLVYVGLGALLAVAAFALLVSALKSSFYALWNRAFSGQVVSILDQVLVVLLVVELLYTVQVSFRERGLLAEPFLVVALIAAVRRVLIITAEMTKLPEANAQIFHQILEELALLTVMILVLVGSLIMLQRQNKQHPRQDS